MPVLRRFAKNVTLVSRLSRSLKVIGTKHIDRLPVTRQILRERQRERERERDRERDRETE